MLCRHTHDLRIHQLQVRVSGWEQVSPVSVDKVGIFFRYAAPDKNTSSSSVGSPISRTSIIHPHVYFSALPPVRVVFAVTMEGSARKVVTVRSSLIVKKQAGDPNGASARQPVSPRQFCVALRKENYPDYMPSNIFSDSAKQIYRQPGHTVFLLPTVVICNLLPCELNFYVKGTALRGTLKSGKEMALHTADTSQNFELVSADTRKISDIADTDIRYQYKSMGHQVSEGILMVPRV
ncbi:unnamed protein product [Ranitomeya imitator]|uniref:Vacuolar protein sorting-associated protein 13 VPS13 adaptor binding domain-containing protein n=1 Tax=Ranitomeya imitator TaxID=111125 RepID=A0ABN9LZB8_9NEOB|nr:unnamed protein product [Ranitomeya imitator]